MVLNDKKGSIQNAMLGRKIPHPTSTKFDDREKPPAKRLKTYESTDIDESRDVSEEEEIPRTPKYEIPDSDEDNLSDDNERPIPAQPTELESALGPVKTDKEAIEEYEAMIASDVPEDLKSRLNQRSWTKGKSSIYVDAFNLALETVLEDEGHLFDEKEMKVFEEWRQLEYEAQYL
jgi:fanconi-associated nuclease 1